MDMTNNKHTMNASTLATPFDTPAGSAAQYAKGLEIGRAALAVHIAVNGTWSADMRTDRPSERRSISSYEKLGYHADTAALLRGFVESGCQIVDHRGVR